MKKLRSDYKSFLDFLKIYNSSFSIPYYQRKYIWSEKNNQYILIKFIRDIINQFVEDSDKSYFIGNFAMCKSSVNDIVDGQQRITTLLILLKVVASYTKEDMKKIMYANNNTFILSDSELSYNLRGFLFNENTEKDVNGNINIAIELIKKEIESFAKKNSLEVIKNFGEYILSSVYLSYIEFDNEKDALKYFLNINSLSVPLTEIEIFYAYTSELIQITKNNEIKIDDLKRNLERVDNKIKAVTSEDFIYIFLEAYFKNDLAIKYLDGKKTGVGRWLSGYKMDILNGGIIAVNFLANLVQYIYDAEIIIDYLLGTKSGCSSYKQIYFNYLYNRYTRNKNVKYILLGLFINRHDYNGKNIYKKGTTDIDPKLLDSYCKAANAVIVTHIFGGFDEKKEHTLLDQLLTYTNSKTPASIIIKNINYDNMFNLNYRTDTQDPKYKIADNHDEIQFILSVQEAYLNNIASPETCTMNTVLYELLDPSGKFTIEHLFTKKDFTESSRRNEWEKKGLFSEDSPAKYDLVRSKFENLSLLDRNTNSSVGAKTISLKLFDYKNACEILTTKEPELLVQSYVSDSKFYNNENIKALNIPTRVLKIDDNSITWENSENNRSFIKQVSKLAVEKLFE